MVVVEGFRGRGVRKLTVKSRIGMKKAIPARITGKLLVIIPGCCVYPALVDPKHVPVDTCHRIWRVGATALASKQPWCRHPGYLHLICRGS